MAILRLAIAGDLHGAWGLEDKSLLLKLQPDGVLFVGDLSDGDLKLTKSIKALPIPTAVILGNHDTGRDHSGRLLQAQLNLLGDLHCGWSLRSWDKPDISVVGARPCSPGGGFYLSDAVRAVFGSISLVESASRISSAALNAPKDKPLVVLAHAGPTGLGSEANSPCGRDWKKPAIDWGDKDLELAVNQIRRKRIPDLVVFGHMHHSLKRSSTLRKTIYQDCWGTVYLNSACVPRNGLDVFGRNISHFSWVEFTSGKLTFVSHRWFSQDGEMIYEDVLLDRTRTNS
ncbi:TIGR04168 family protein [Prochlorococcus sp. MIT 1300]|uniref:TIGR04168 family protein n=1 Tax=Prochlorococcus sp. MIT 1300 TaxID=3096218 RepID=UPI002A764B96|nr:TIGR04168 family protein [Prochlorococcus sp. MIT 1300]